MVYYKSKLTIQNKLTKEKSFYLIVYKYLKELQYVERMAIYKILWMASLEDIKALTHTKKTLHLVEQTHYVSATFD